MHLARCFKHSVFRPSLDLKCKSDQNKLFTFFQHFSRGNWYVIYHDYRKSKQVMEKDHDRCLVEFWKNGHSYDLMFLLIRQHFIFPLVGCGYVLCTQNLFLLKGIVSGIYVCIKIWQDALKKRLAYLISQISPTIVISYSSVTMYAYYHCPLVYLW